MSRWYRILMKTPKPLKKAQENWIKLAISQSGPAAALKQKALVHNTQGETVLRDVFLLPFSFPFFFFKTWRLKLGLFCSVSVLTSDLIDAPFPP